MKQLTVKICIVFMLLVSVVTVTQAQQSAFQGTWLRDFTPKYYDEKDDYRLEIAGTNWSYFVRDIIQGAGTARFSAGSADLLLANGSIYSRLTLLAPGYIQASEGIYSSFRILDVALVEAKAVEFANAYYKSGNSFMSTGYVADWFKYYAGAPSFLFREIYKRACLLIDRSEELIKQGNKKSDRGDYDGAIADFTEAIRLAPNYVYAYNIRGVVYRQKGDYDRAIADFEEALKINPNLEKNTREKIEQDIELARQAKGR